MDQQQNQPPIGPQPIPGQRLQHVLHFPLRHAGFRLRPQQPQPQPQPQQPPQPQPQQQHEHHQPVHVVPARGGVAVRGINPVHGGPMQGVHQAPIQIQLQLQQQQRQGHHQHNHHQHNHHHHHHHGPLGDHGDHPENDSSGLPLHPTKKAIQALAHYLQQHELPQEPATWRIPNVVIDPTFVLDTLIPLDDETTTDDNFPLTQGAFIVLIRSLEHYAKVLNSAHLYAFLTRWGPSYQAVSPKDWDSHLRSIQAVQFNPSHPHNRNPTFSPQLVIPLLTHQIIFDPSTKMSINNHQIVAYHLALHHNDEQFRSFILRAAPYDFYLSQLFSQYNGFSDLVFANMPNSQQIKYIKAVLKDYFPKRPELREALESFTQPFELEWKKTCFFQDRDGELSDAHCPPLWLLASAHPQAFKWMIKKGYYLPMAWYDSDTGRTFNFVHFLLVDAFPLKQPNQSSSQEPSIVDHNSPERKKVRQDVLDLLTFLFEELEQYQPGSDPQSYINPVAKSESNCPLELAIMMGDTEIVEYLSKQGYKLDGPGPLATHSFLAALLQEQSRKLVLDPLFQWIIKQPQILARINSPWVSNTISTIVPHSSLNRHLSMLSTKQNQIETQIEVTIGADGTQTTTTKNRRAKENLSICFLNPLAIALALSPRSLHPSLAHLFSLPLDSLELNVVVNANIRSHPNYLLSRRSKYFVPVVSNMKMTTEQIRQANPNSLLLKKIDQGKPVTIIEGLTIPQLLSLLCSEVPSGSFSFLASSTSQKEPHDDHYEDALDSFLDRYCAHLIDEDECEFFDLVEE